MKAPLRIAEEHVEVTRRYFLRLAAAGVASLSALPGLAHEKEAAKRFAKDIAYITPSEKFRNVERHKPLAYKLPPEERLKLGLERET